MSSSSTKLQSLSIFFSQLLSNVESSLSSQKDDLYHDVLNLGNQKESILRKDENKFDQVKLKDEHSEQSLYGKNELHFIDEKNTSTEERTQNIKTQNTETHEESNPSKSKFKINPRLNKLSKISKNISKATSPEHIELSPENKSESKEKFASQIKQMTLKKLELKNKLRKLNSELEKQKHSYFSFKAYQEDLNESHRNPEEENLLAKLKNSSLISNKNPSPSFNFSRLKSKSDAQFNLKRQSIKDKEAVYSPEKHEAAFKLIEKMHSEKLKKHEKILNDMKKKQEKEIETVKRLEIERKKEKEEKIKRQRVLLTPNSRDSPSKSFISFSDRKKIHSKSQHNVLDVSMRERERELHENLLKEKIRKRTPTECIEENSEEENRLTELTKNTDSRTKNNEKIMLILRKSVEELENEFIS